MDWEKLLMVLAVVVLWFLGLFLREAVNSFMKNIKKYFRK